MFLILHNLKMTSKKREIIAIFMSLLTLTVSLSLKHLGTELTVTLKSDSGKYLGRCNGCGNGAYPDSAAVHVTNPSDPWARFTLKFLTANTISLKADSGKFLSRCNNCWQGGANPDSAFIHVSAIQGNPWAVWTLQYRNNGKWALKADSGKYLARCNGCVPGGADPDFAFVHQTNPDNAWALWTIDELLPIGQKVKLQSDIGLFMSRCNGCGPGAYPDSVGVHSQGGAEGHSQFLLQSTGGNQVALQADTGKYVARCNGCWTGGADPDSAFIHVDNPSGNPWANWQLQWKGQTKWAFKGDNNKYLARCNGCVRGGLPNTAFVHEPNSNNPWAIWVLSRA